MSTVMHLSSVFSPISETLSAVPSSDSLPKISSDSSSPCQYYKIEDTRQSECARILFTQHTFTGERVVMKILREYKDTRYSLATPDERQQCQLEALRRNRMFTPEVYIGLAPVCNEDPSQGGIAIGEVMSNPTEEMLDVNAEYALLMQQLPEERRLDYLLKEEEDASLWHYIKFLTEHIASVHTGLAPIVSKKGEVRWGSYEQLEKKLQHNFGLFDSLMTTSEGSRYSDGDWLKETLFQLFKRSQYAHYFEQRVQEQQIKHCHGDLKALHIWIVPSDGELAQCIKTVDAIDFNPAYSIIDTLSDFAMLVIDIQAHTKSASLANEMIKYYLELTEQENKVARAVLDYYLVEKALVGAAISIVYDNLPELGRSLLEVAQMRLNCLVGDTH